MSFDGPSERMRLQFTGDKPADNHGNNRGRGGGLLSNKLAVLRGGGGGGNCIQELHEPILIKEEKLKANGFATPPLV